MSEEPLSEQLYKYMLAKVNAGYQITDKDSLRKLRKESADAFKLKKGSYDIAIKASDRVLQEKGLKAKLTESTFQGEGVKAKLSKEIIKIPEAPIPQLPAPTPEAPRPEVKQVTVLSPEDKVRYEDLCQQGTDFLADLYVRLGLVEGKAEEKPMTAETFKEGAVKVGKQWGDYLYAHNYKLPMWIELLALICTTFMVFGMPLFQVFLFGKKEKKKAENDTELEKIKVE